MSPDACGLANMFCDVEDTCIHQGDSCSAQLGKGYSLANMFVWFAYDFEVTQSLDHLRGALGRAVVVEATNRRDSTRAFGNLQ